MKVTGVVIIALDEMLPRSVMGTAYSRVVHGTTVAASALPGLVVAVWIAIRVPQDTETRCRRCGYILRGLAEPRCPECGERI